MDIIIIIIINVSMADVVQCNIQRYH